MDAIMVGASDLRFALGLPPGIGDGDEPSFVGALNKIQKAADEASIPVLGFATTSEIIRKRMALGWRAFICHGDVTGIIISGTRSLDMFLKLVKDTAS